MPLDRRVPLSLLLTGILAACSGGGTEPAATGNASITIVGAPCCLVMGDTVRLTAKVTDKAGATVPGAAIQWSTDTPTLLSVSSGGLVTALASGTGVLRATSGTLTATATIAVSAPAGPSEISILSAPRIMVLGDSALAVARVADGAGAPMSGVTVTWSSESPGGVSVSPEGWIRALQKGPGRIRASTGPLSATASIEVVDPSPLRFVALSGGPNDTCGRTGTGEVYCWGWSVPRPTKVQATRPFVAVANGMKHVCALDAGGLGWCWGDNGWEQLGVPEATRSSVVPVQVGGGMSFALLEVGNDFGCALTAVGDAYCWGSHGFGELGTGNLALLTSPVPVAVVGGHKYVALAGGSLHSCGLRTDGKALCWGDNQMGEIGNGLPPPSGWPAVTTPALVAGGLTFASLGAGFQFSCGLTTGGTVYCWGQGDRGRLGNGDPSNRNVPVPIATSEVFAELTVGAEHACARTASGRIACWGNNEWGQLGVPPTGGTCPSGSAGGSLPCASRPTFWPVDAIRFRSVVAGGVHTCGLDSRGLAYCWGANGIGQLGNAGVHSSAPIPVQPPE